MNSDIIFMKMYLHELNLWLSNGVISIFRRKYDAPQELCVVDYTLSFVVICTNKRVARKTAAYLHIVTVELGRMYDST